MADNDTPEEAQAGEVQADKAPVDAIPPADSNDQLAVATAKRNAAAGGFGAQDAAGRRKAHADAAAGDDKGAQREARAKAPEGRTTRPVSKA